VEATGDTVSDAGVPAFCEVVDVGVAVDDGEVLGDSDIGSARCDPPHPSIIRTPTPQSPHA
jgi:hypothetical protein